MIQSMIPTVILISLRLDFRQHFLLCISSLEIQSRQCNVFESLISTRLHSTSLLQQSAAEQVEVQFSEWTAYRGITKTCPYFKHFAIVTFLVKSTNLLVPLTLFEEIFSLDIIVDAIFIDWISRTGCHVI
jgi:hypothetical protein